MNIKTLLVFASGLAVGAIGGVALTRRRFEEYAEEEINSMREIIREKEAKLKIKQEKIIAEAASMTDEEVATVTKDTRKDSLKGEDGVKNVKNYHKIAGNYDRSGALDRENERHEYEKMSRNANNGNVEPPFVITPEQFGDEEEHYEKISLYFYEDDNVLTEENEEVVEDVERHVGDCLKDFGVKSGDPELVYVRNHRLQSDYEIIRLSKSYRETVMGE